ncbi:nuclear transport factor 2 family protein [Couchioplanes caeruleus]|uniref:YybH family protein n=1 Tax=Couchioplanes caeruleus TaxID=56438 RepID=UPI0020BF185D|nr:nuclear transport factor 2 family protein [Couchioplanes caeruleus]UQU62090.1 nuclear transport factor 2 family protein [Couchioplanes caeruleus]
MQFGEAVDHHLSTIAARDLNAFLATVHDDVSLVAPNGRLLAGRDEVAAFHREWFGDPDWSWALEPLRRTEAGGTGVAIHGVTYSDLDADGKPYTMTYVLTLVFARIGGAWLLLHDQNTVT